MCSDPFCIWGSSGSPGGSSSPSSDGPVATAIAVGIKLGFGLRTLAHAAVASIPEPTINPVHIGHPFHITDINRGTLKRAAELPFNLAYQAMCLLGCNEAWAPNNDTVTRPAPSTLQELDKYAAFFIVAVTAKAGAGEEPVPTGPRSTRYHYTTESGLEGILETGEIWESRGETNARHGNGQYFTVATDERGYQFHRHHR